jgi:hypothetical protein
VEEHAVVTTAPQPLPPEVVEKVVIGGDLAGLNPAQRAEYYGAVCRSLGLNPLTKPFEYLNLNGKLRLYALRDCADQLRRLHGISIYIANRERLSDIYIVTARAKDRHGREDESTGAVTVGNLKGDALANALMKAETKAKRRVTLSIAGLGWLDETELDTIPQGQTVPATPPTETDGKKAREESAPTADQISALIEMARSCGVDLSSFGDHMRQLMNLSKETKITKKFLRETMTRSQFEQAWQHYNDMLKGQVEMAASDAFAVADEAESSAEDSDSAPTAERPGSDDDEPTPAAEGGSDSTYATPQQIAALKLLAKQVGNDASADVQDMLDQHPEGLVLGVYEIVRQRLKARKAAKKAESSAVRRP